MKPGATTRPSASMMRLAVAPAYLPTPTILPSWTATSAANAGSPEPSTTRPFFMSRSYAMILSPHCPAPCEPEALAAGGAHRASGPPAPLSYWCTPQPTPHLGVHQYYLQ